MPPHPPHKPRRSGPKPISPVCRPAMMLISPRADRTRQNHEGQTGRDKNGRRGLCRPARTTTPLFRFPPNPGQSTGGRTPGSPLCRGACSARQGQLRHGSAEGLVQKSFSDGRQREQAQHGPSVRFWAAMCQCFEWCKFGNRLSLDCRLSKTAIFAVPTSLNISINCKFVTVRDHFMAKLRPNLDRATDSSHSPLASGHEGQPLKQVHILLVLQQRAVQFRQGMLALPPQILWPQILGQQQLQPIQHFRG